MRFSRWQAGLAFLAAFLGALPARIGGETLTLTTYYPPPYGVYARFATSSDAVLARDEGRVVIGAQPAPAPPQEVALYVNGKMRIRPALVPGDSDDTVVTKGFSKVHAMGFSLGGAAGWALIATYNAGCVSATSSSIYCISACNRYCKFSTDAGGPYTGGTITEAHTTAGLMCDCWR